MKARLLATLLACALLSLPTWAAPNFNVAGSTRRLNFGSNTVLDNLAVPASGMTVVAWIDRQANGDNQFIAGKDNTTGWLFQVAISGGSAEGSLQFVCFRAGGTTNFVVNEGVLAPLDSWTFVAATFVNGASPAVEIYYAQQNRTLAKAATFSANADGSGTPNDDSAVNFTVGNGTRTTTLPFLGAIGFIGAWNRQLTRVEINQEFVKGAPPQTMTPAIPAGNVLYAYLDGTTPQQDRSPYGNIGYLENNVGMLQQPPLLLPMARRRLWDAPAAAAGGATKKRLPLLGAG